MNASLRRRHARILGQLDRMIAVANDPAKLGCQDSEVSQWSVAQQIEHTTRVLRSVVDTLEKLIRGEGEGPADPKPIGRVILLVGWIPRGRGKAPEWVRPKGFDSERLMADLARERQRLEELDLGALDRAEGTLPHTIFGSLTSQRWLRFLEIHNHHHWKIVRKLLQSAR